MQSLLCFSTATSPPTTNLTTVSPASTSPMTKPPVSVPVQSVSFLGMELSVSDAETGLVTTFSLLIVAAFGIICSTFCFCKARKQGRKKSLNDIQMTSTYFK